MSVFLCLSIWFSIPFLFCVVGTLMEVFWATPRWLTFVLIVIGSVLGSWLANVAEKQLREKKIRNRRSGAP